MRALAVTSLAFVSALGCVDNGPGRGSIGGTAASGLSPDEDAQLRFTREEEKLARDVYAALDAYGQPFVNIQDSEQRHFDAVGGLLVTYGLDDPAAGQPPGAFTDPTLQSLYSTLVDRGLPSRIAALGVGCEIEDLDLRDLAVATAATTHPDIATVYANLALGSRNHLRAFYGQMVAAGGTYTPQYIDQATFDAIVTSPHEQGGR